MATFRNTKSGVRATFGNVSIDAEIADGIRIMKFSNGFKRPDDPQDPNYTEWNVEYAKRFNLLLPSKAKLICGDDKADIELTWVVVNEPIETGKETAVRFSKELPKAKVAKP